MIVSRQVKYPSDPIPRIGAATRAPDARRAQGREFTADPAAAMMNVPDSESFLTTINPGNSVNGVLVFAVPEGVAPASIELHDSMFSSGVLVSLAG
jgi:hypothetical protein